MELTGFLFLESAVFFSDIDTCYKVGRFMKDKMSADNKNYPAAKARKILLDALKKGLPPSEQVKLSH